MKRTFRLLSLVLCVALAAAFAVPAFAARAKNYVVIGDSIGVGAGISNPDEANYGRIIADTNGYNYSNRAVSGSRTSDLLDRLRGNAGEIADVKNADIISISIGGNDYLRENMAALSAQAAVGNMDTFNSIENSLRRNFEQIISLIRRYNPNAVILAQTLYNPAPGYKPYEEAVKRVNNVVLGYADGHPGEIEIVDVASAFSGKIGLIAADTIHPNAEGNVVIAGAVQAKLYALGLASTADITVNAAGMDWVPRPTSILGWIRNWISRIVTMIRNMF